MSCPTEDRSNAPIVSEFSCSLKALQNSQYMQDVLELENQLSNVQRLQRMNFNSIIQI